MSFKEINLKPAYDSEEDDMLNDFYIPVLSRAKTYDRLAGFFSSTTLAAAAKGISRFIKNKGKMRLITSAKLRDVDLEAIKQGLYNTDEVLTNLMVKDIDSITDELIKDHVKALAWMVANKLLEIKVAIPKYENYYTSNEQPLYHQKVGILYDKEDNIMSFSGSINESATAWLYNIEEFKVFRSWIDGEREYLENDINKFEKYWNGNTKYVNIIDMPKAIRDKFIELAPSNIDEIDLEKWYKIKTIRLRDYQYEAVKNWLNNSCRGIFEMATGTGKTYTAIECIKEALNREPSLAVVISVPYIHLIRQWQNNLSRFNLNAIELFGNSTNWKKRLGNEIIDLNNNIINRLLILTTHDTLSNPIFIKQINNLRVPALLVVDEVHSVGSKVRSNALLDKYEYRLGLTATPNRYFDDEGTMRLLSYFNGIVARFDLKDAIEHGYLVPYEYYPHYVELTKEEFEEYRRFTRKIASQWDNAEDDETRKSLENLLLVQRQKIIVNAKNKLVKFEELVSELKDLMDHCLVYCSEKQLEPVQKILNKHVIINQKVTFKEDFATRNDYLKKFDEGIYKVIAAINCLDEGIDIPSTKMAIILASSGNPKQYIQRRGRILRPSKNKDKAILHDILVIPSLLWSTDDIAFKLEKKIVEKELKRHLEMASIALNKDESIKNINFIKELFHIST